MSRSLCLCRFVRKAQLGIIQYSCGMSGNARSVEQSSNPVYFRLVNLFFKNYYSIIKIPSFDQAQFNTCSSSSTRTRTAAATSSSCWCLHCPRTEAAAMHTSQVTVDVEAYAAYQQHVLRRAADGSRVQHRSRGTAAASSASGAASSRDAVVPPALPYHQLDYSLTARISARQAASSLLAQQKEHLQLERAAEEARRRKLQRKRAEFARRQDEQLRAYLTRPRQPYTRNEAKAAATEQRKLRLRYLHLLGGHSTRAQRCSLWSHLHALFTRLRLPMRLPLHRCKQFRPPSRPSVLHSHSFHRVLLRASHPPMPSSSLRCARICLQHPLQSLGSNWERGLGFVQARRACLVDMWGEAEYARVSCMRFHCRACGSSHTAGPSVTECLERCWARYPL